MSPCLVMVWKRWSRTLNGMFQQSPGMVSELLRDRCVFVRDEFATVSGSVAVQASGTKANVRVMVTQTAAVLSPGLILIDREGGQAISGKSGLLGILPFCGWRVGAVGR